MKTPFPAATAHPMKSARAFCWAVAAGIAFLNDAVAAREWPLNGHTFTLEDGFSIELVAGPDLAPRPVSASFDSEGRLYVTDSSGSNQPPAEQLKDPRSRILRLEDKDRDGRFDTSTVYADRVMFPQGCLWHGGSVYVAGPPSIWKFTDTDGDGVADRREEWYQGKVITGCANDVHGPYLGPEGMIYWTKGAFARLDLKDHRGRSIQDRCAHIFRSWPDGSGFESVMSGGMDNPVEVAFTPEGEPIVISTFIDLSQPGRRDGLAHAVYGGVFGKINDVVDEPMVQRTGDLLPAMTHYGPAAACALMRYESDVFGPGYRDNLFGTLFNLRKVTRHILIPKASTYVTEDSDFLVSDQMDFHPTDVLEDVDGSMLIIDTGGWYKLCCPSSQLVKADVLGGLYRVRRGVGAAPTSLRATDEQRGKDYARLILPPRLRPDSPVVTTKRAALKADAGSAISLRETLVGHASRAGQSSESAQLARVAAEGLGRLRDAGAVQLLFGILTNSSDLDRFLEHSAIYALIQIADATGTRSFARAENLLVRRAALLVLEQIDRLQPDEVLPELESRSVPLRETAQWICRRHPEWSEELTRHVRRRLDETGPSSREKTDWEPIFSLLARDPAGQAFLAEATTDPGLRAETWVAALSAMANSGVKEVPAPWRDALASWLTRATAPGEPFTDSPPSPVASAVRAVRSLPFPKEGDPQISAALHALARSSRPSTSLRVQALGALPANSGLGDTEFSVLLSAMAPEGAPSERLSAADALGRLQPTGGQLARLTAVVRTAGPLELPKLLAAYGSGGDEALGASLLAALKESKALRAVRPEDLKTHLGKFPEAVQHDAADLLASLQTDASQDRARLDVLLTEIHGLDGQVRRGQAVFNGAKAACSSCHRLGYLGGNVGPDLTAIGSARSERDLLEAVLFPSASFVRSYEPWIASTKNGEEYSGTLRRDTPEEIILATGPNAEIRLARSTLADLRLGAVSTMPAGLDQQLTPQELADLLAFLKNTKWGAN